MKAWIKLEIGWSIRPFIYVKSYFVIRLRYFATTLIADLAGVSIATDSDHQPYTPMIRQQGLIRLRLNNRISPEN